MNPEMIKNIGLGAYQQAQGTPAAQENKFSGFKEILKAETARQEVHFSAHALNRLGLQKKTLTDAEMVRIHKGMEKAADKGARDAVMIMDDIAFIVNVQNRTVVTAIDKNRLKENVFTNIDSVLLI